MSHESHPEAALSYLGNAVWTLATVSAVAAVFLFFLPGTDGPASLREAAHPDTCRACSSSPPEARAVRDASLIGDGAIEAPTASDGLPRGEGPASLAAPDGA